MAVEKIQIMKIANEEITTRKGVKRQMRVVHCFVHSERVHEETGAVIYESFVAKTAIFDDDLKLEAGQEYVVNYRLAEGYGVDAGRLVPRIVAWTPLIKAKPVPKPAGAPV